MSPLQLSTLSSTLRDITGQRQLQPQFWALLRSSRGTFPFEFAGPLENPPPHRPPDDKCACLGTFFRYRLQIQRNGAAAARYLLVAAHSTHAHMPSPRKATIYGSSPASLRRKGVCMKEEYARTVQAARGHSAARGQRGRADVQQQQQQLHPCNRLFPITCRGWLFWGRGEPTAQSIAKEKSSPKSFPCFPDWTTVGQSRSFILPDRTHSSPFRLVPVCAG